MTVGTVFDKPLRSILLSEAVFVPALILGLLHTPQLIETYFLIVFSLEGVVTYYFDNQSVFEDNVCVLELHLRVVTSIGSRFLQRRCLLRFCRGTEPDVGLRRKQSR